MHVIYEDGVRKFLGTGNYELCLSNCDNGVISPKLVEEMAQCLDQRILGSLRTEISQDPNSNTRDRFRFIMSEWFNIAHEGNEPETQFNVSALIEMLRHDNVRQFPLASALAKLNRINISRTEDTMEEKTEEPRRGQEAANERVFSKDNISEELAEEKGPEVDIPTEGRKVALNEMLINAVSFYMRDLKFDEQLMTVFAMKIGQEKLFNALITRERMVAMDVIMKRLLVAWNRDIDATEENLVRYLRDFKQFKTCVKFLEDHINQTRSLHRTLSEPNLSGRGGSDQNLNISNESFSSQILQSKTVLHRTDLNPLIKQAKKKVKDYSVFTNFATCLGVNHLGVGQAIREMEKSRTWYSFEGSNRESIMQTILLQWMLMRDDKGTAEELIRAMQNSTRVHSCGVFNDSINYLLNIIQMANATPQKCESTFQLNVNMNRPSNFFGTLIRGKKSRNYFST